MNLTNFIRDIVKKNPELKLDLKKSGSRLTPFQYVYQTLVMTLFSFLTSAILVFLIFKSNFLNLIIAFLVLIFFITPMIYKFWFSYVKVQIRKYGRELDGDLLFITEYFLVSLESGLPLGNSIKRISKLNRPGGKFFDKIYTDFKTGKDLETSISDAIYYSPSESLKKLLKKLKDSLNIGVDLQVVLVNFINESSEEKIIEIKGFSKKLNPIIMMYLLLGIVLPSLGVTFFILGAAIINMTPQFLKYMLIFTFLIMFGFQYLAFSIFKFSKSTI